MQRANYQEFIINAYPRQRVGDGRWSMSIAIERHHGDGVTVGKYSAANTFETESEAAGHCLNFGRQVIDGMVQNCATP